jgi:hypothetical protein
MRLRIFFIVFIILNISALECLNAQEASRAARTIKTSAKADSLSLKKPDLIHCVLLKEPEIPSGIKIDRDASEKYLEKVYSSGSMWRNRQDPLRVEIGELLYACKRPPFDSTRVYLISYPYDSIRVPWKSFFVIDSVKISAPVTVPDTASVDSTRSQEPREIVLRAGDRTRKVKLLPDNSIQAKNDTLFINDSVYTFISGIIPAALPRKSADTVLYFIADTLSSVSLQKGDGPFRKMKYPFVTDTIAAAVRSLLSFLDDRDSTLITFSGQGRGHTDIWLNSNSDNFKRFWIYDDKGDSVTVWIGSQSRDTIILKTEEGVDFRRHGLKDELVHTRIKTVSARDESLRAVQFNKLKPYTWSYKGDMSVLFSQGYFSNWVSGGNSYYSSAIDLKGYLYYVNKQSQISWTTTGRFAVGLIKTENVSMRKNLDIIDISSKLNHRAFNKVDLSGQLQFKTQSFPGYNYSKTPAETTSKFFNPATLIIGYGLDYKPMKNISINVSPLSYKGIYVPDTAHIDQTLYGVDKNRRSKNEMGIYTTVNTTNTIFKKITLVNKFQFFSNFLHEPQNVDVDWEMTASASLVWFADIKVNTFLIYDDETLTPVYDKKGNPVYDANGIQKKSPRVQFKELLGVTLAFRF